MDTSPQQTLGASNSFNRTPDIMLHMVDSKRCCIRELPLGLRPNIFIGINFRSVSRKSVRMNSGMTAQESAHHAPTMNCAAIPYQFNRPPQLLQQLVQKGNHFHSGNIVPMKLRIQSQAVATGRHSDTRNNRDAIPPVTVPQNRSFSDRRPCSPNGGNKQKTAFIKECQVCATTPSLFLYVAKYNVSNERWPLRRAGWRAVLVFERSIAIRPSIVAKQPIRNNAPQRFSPRWHRFASASIIRWGILNSARRASADCQGERVGGCPIGKADRALIGTPNHGVRSVESFDAIERLSLTRHQAARLRREMCNRVVTERWLSAAVALILSNLHVVSWKKL